MRKMKVSVYCLVYNHEKYLRSALEGFVNQKTTFDYEVFVHDDASTDRSAQIIREYAEKYPDLIKPIYQKENQYSRKVRIFSKFILPGVTGEYIAICEGDDYWTDETKLQRQVDFLDSHPDYSACVHNSLKLDMRTHKTTVMYSHDEDEDISFLDAAIGGGECFQTASLMYRVCYAHNRPDFVKKARSFGDYQLAMYLTLSGKVRFINRVMSVYRAGTESSWTKAHVMDMKKIVNVCRENISLLTEVDEYTDYQYHEKLQEYIGYWDYQIHYNEEDYKALRKNPYRKIYMSQSRAYRMKTYLRQYFPKLYQLYRNLKYAKM